MWLSESGGVLQLDSEALLTWTVCLTYVCCCTSELMVESAHKFVETYFSSPQIVSSLCHDLCLVYVHHILVFALFLVEVQSSNLGGIDNTILGN